MINVETIAKGYIASWNEPDAARRRCLIDSLWTENARYVDPMMQADGQDGIAALIGGVHTKFPGYRFALTGRPDGHGSYLRFPGALCRRMVRWSPAAPTSLSWRPTVG
jgi:hypothetical protein